MDGWKTSFLLGNPIFRCELLVSGRVRLFHFKMWPFFLNFQENVALFDWGKCQDRGSRTQGALIWLVLEGSSQLVSVVRITPMYKPFWPFGSGKTRSLGDLWSSEQVGKKITVCKTISQSSEKLVWLQDTLVSFWKTGNLFERRELLKTSGGYFTKFAARINFPLPPKK